MPKKLSMNHISMRIILKNIRCKMLSLTTKISIIRHSLHKRIKIFPQISNLTSRNFRLTTLNRHLIHNWRKLALLKMNLIKDQESCLSTKILKRFENNKRVSIFLSKKIWNKKFLVRELNKEVSNLSSHQKCQKSGKCSTKKGKNQENILHGKLGKINMVKIQDL